jgi:methyltransferase-like protein
MEELPKVNPELVFIRESEESMLFDPRTGSMKMLNDSAAFIFKLLDGMHSREEILDLLVEHFDQALMDEVRQDLDDFVRDLQESQLLE